MALIKCEDCGKEFSDKANACPNCGCPNEKNNKSELLFKTNWNGGVRKGQLEVYNDKIIVKVDTNYLFQGKAAENTYFYKNLFGISFRKSGIYWKGIIQFNSGNPSIDDIFYINFTKSENEKFEKYYNTMMECYNKSKGK